LKRLSVIGSVSFIEEFDVKKRMEQRRGIRICWLKGTVRFSVSGKGSFTVFPKYKCLEHGNKSKKWSCLTLEKAKAQHENKNFGAKLS
jgi:hypothetical protein